MARGADGSLLTARQLKELNRQRFLDGLAKGDLYNTGPITEEGGTSFSTDRWADYFKANPDEAPSDWTGDTKSYIEKPRTDQEFLADMDKMEVYDEDDNLIYADGKEVTPQDRGLEGERDDEGNFKTYMRPIDIKDGEVTIKDEQVPIEDVLAGIEQRKGERAERAKDREKRMTEVNAIDVDAEVTAEMAQEEAESQIEQEDSVANWTTNFEAMSDEMFKSIKPEDLGSYSENAMTAYNNVLNARSDIAIDKDAQGMLTSPSLDSGKKTQAMADIITGYGLDEGQAGDLISRLKGLCN